MQQRDSGAGQEQQEARGEISEFSRTRHCGAQTWGHDGGAAAVLGDPMAAAQPASLGVCSVLSYSHRV